MATQLVLMIIMHMLAAQLAHVDHLIFYTVDKNDNDSFKEAMKILKNEILTERRPVQVMEILKRIESLGFK